MTKRKLYSLTDEHRAQLKPWADKWIDHFKPPLVLAHGMVLHRADGRYTEAAEAILRDGAALDLAGLLG